MGLHPNDLEAVRRVLTFLEDRRLLFGLRHVEDEYHCLRSAMEIRATLTDVLSTATTSREVKHSLKIMRAACRAFIEAAGPDAENFQHRDSYGIDTFSVSLGELRATMGLQVGMLAEQAKVEIEEELASIVISPLDDPDFIPGFNDD